MSERSGRNILFVVMDTVRKDHLTPYGYHRPTTPTLAAFAEEARVYDEAVAQAPWTLPVHASMFTGLYPAEHTATQESPYLKQDVGTLADALSQAGYSTACYSSNAWITPYTRLTQGFDDQANFFDALPSNVFSGLAASLWQRLTDSRARWLADRLVEVGNDIHEYLARGDRSDSKTPAIIDRVLSFTDAHAGPDDNWFVFINLMDAHLPYYPPQPHRDTFAAGVDPQAVCQNSKEFNSGARTISDAEFKDIRRLYDAEINFIDAELERLFTGLRAADQWEDTVVVVCSDHGELHGEHDLYGHEFAVYDNLINVPLLMKHPRLDSGRSDDQVELLDLYDTILETGAATEVPGDIGGRPYTPTRSLLADDRTGTDSEYAFIEYHRPVVELQQLETKAQAAGIDLSQDSRFYSRMRAARRPDGKYIWNERIPDEAYRLDTDPGETDPVTGDDPVIADIKTALERFEARSAATWSKGDPVDADADEAIAEMDEAATERLKDLGYLE